MINGLGIGDDKVYTVDFLIKDFLSESAFPYTLPPNMNDDEDHNQQIESIQTVFISAGRIADLASVFKLQIIQKFAPGLQKEGYKESAHAASQATTTSRQQPNPDRDQPPRHPSADIQDNPFAPPFAQPRAIHDPLIGPPPRPFPAGDFPPPGFEDEYDLNRPQLGGGGRRPVNIGERDLYPQGLGPHDPLRSGGFGPTGGFGGGGMHPTFDDPIFGGGGGASGIGGFDGRYVPFHTGLRFPIFHEIPFHSLYTHWSSLSNSNFYATSCPRLKCHNNVEHHQGLDTTPLVQAMARHISTVVLGFREAAAVGWTEGEDKAAEETSWVDVLPIHLVGLEATISFEANESNDRHDEGV